MRWLGLLACAGAIALGTSACAGTTASPRASQAAMTDVHRHLLAVSRAFSGWRAHPVRYASAGCGDPRGGNPVARIDHTYDEPPELPRGQSALPYARQAFVSVMYFSPADARRVVSGYATSDQLHCLRPRYVKDWQRFYRPYVAKPICLSHRHCIKPPPRFTRCCGVRLAADLPHSIAAAAGGRLRGFSISILPLHYFQRVYEVSFVYTTPRDPHVVYQVELRAFDPKKLKLANADTVLERLALDVIRATR